MTIKPINDNIVIAIETEAEQVSKSGIVIVSNEQNTTNQGVVVATGRGRVLQNGNILPVAVEENDRVLFNKFAGTAIELEGKEYLLMKENDILATL